MGDRRGFTIVELLIAMTLLLAVMAAVVAIVRGAPELFVVQAESSDMHQRLRVAAGTLVGDLMSAEAVQPYRSHGPDAEAPGSFRRDVITIVGPIRTTTYWLKADDRAAVYQLMSYAGGVSPDVPVVDNVVGLDFDYSGDPQPPGLVRPLDDVRGPWTSYGPRPSLVPIPPYASRENCVFALDDDGAPVPRLASLAPSHISLVPLTAAQLADGPWCPDALAADRWDADLLRVRVVRVRVRVQAAASALRGPTGVLFAHAGTSHAAARLVPDLEIQLQVAPRNLNRGR